MIDIGEEVIVRSPALKYSCDLSKVNVERLKDTPLVRTAIMNASQVLYTEIYVKNNSTDKVQSTLYKYLVRMHFRATPFGLFSGVGLCSWGKQNEILRNSFSKVAIRDKANFSARKLMLKESSFLYLNPSIYLFNDEFRFYEFQIGKKSTRHVVSSYPYSDEVIEIYNLFPAGGVKCSALIEKLKNNGWEKEDAFEALEMLMEDHFLRVTEEVDYIFDPGDKHLLLSNYKNTTIPEKPKLWQNNVDLSYDFTKSTLDNKYKFHLKEAVTFLARSCEAPKQESMVDFSTRFFSRYGHNKVNLLEALDPVNGIGYGGFSNDNEGKASIGDGQFLFKSTEGKTDLSATDRFLLKRLVKSSKTNSKIIVFTKNDFKFKNKKIKLPATSSLGFKIINDEGEDKLYVRYMSGSSALSMFGRFAYLDEKMELLAKKICSFENTVWGSHTIIADLAIYPDDVAANVVQRKCFTSHFIDCGIPLEENFNAEKRIPLNDLSIQWINDEIFLFSNKLGKRIIPKNLSAFNHKISPSQIYTFLADLQYQNLDTNLSFKWGAAGEFFDFLPRVEYQNMIFYPATWKLKVDQFPEVFKSKTELDKFITDKAIPNEFILKDGDRELPVNLYNDLSYAAFFATIKNRGQIIITEILAASKALSDQENNSYNYEFIVPVFSSENKASYKVHSNEIIQSNFLFGEKWLYYKLYSNETITSKILAKLYAFVNDDTINTLIEKWFFIRYGSKHEKHIRFRIKAKSMRDFGRINEAFFECLNSLLSANELYKIEPDTYTREIDRYTSEHIETCETIFSIDSKLNLELAPFKEDNPNEVYVLAQSLLEMYYRAFSCEIDEILFQLNRQVEFLMENYNNTSEIRKSANEYYRQNRSTNEHKLAKLNDRFLPFSKMIENEISELKKTVTSNKLTGLITSLIHMSLNRFFPSNQLNNELMVYLICSNYHKEKKFNKP